MRAFPLFYTFNERDFYRSGAHCLAGVELDPGYAQAHAYKAWWYDLLIGESRSKDATGNNRVGGAGAARNRARSHHDAFVLAVGAHVEHFWQAAGNRRRNVERSLQLNENSALAWGLSAATLLLSRPARRGPRAAAQRMALVSVRPVQLHLFTIRMPASPSSSPAATPRRSPGCRGRRENRDSSHVGAHARNHARVGGQCR